MEQTKHNQEEEQLLGKELLFSLSLEEKEEKPNLLQTFCKDSFEDFISKPQRPNLRSKTQKEQIEANESTVNDSSVFESRTNSHLKTQITRGIVYKEIEEAVFEEDFEAETEEVLDLLGFPTTRPTLEEISSKVSSPDFSREIKDFTESGYEFLFDIVKS